MSIFIRPFCARKITSCTIKDLHTLDISGHERSLSQAQRAMVILQEIITSNAMRLTREVEFGTWRGRRIYLPGCSPPFERER
jgi:hypothetical protein